MTDNRETEPPVEEPLTHVGWWCWRGDNHGHLATMACRSDNVPIHVPAEWADDMRAVIQQLEDGDDEQPPATDRATLLREVADRLKQKADALTEGVHDLAMFVAKARIAEAEVLDREADELRRMADEAQQPTDADVVEAHDLALAFTLDTVGARQPDTETQACPDPIECDHEAALGEAEAAIKRVLDWAATLDAIAVEVHGPGTRHPVADHIRELLDTKPAAGGAGGVADATGEATPCSQPNPCEDGGDPCDRHEREQSHAEDDHSLCDRRDCEVLRQS